MLKKSFTPGPWVSEGNWIGRPTRSNCIALAYRIETKLKPDGTHEPCEEMLANAALIAAAPELLEALQAMLVAHGPRNTEEAALEKGCKAAISKALNQS